jgi:hypothetical protein
MTREEEEKKKENRANQLIFTRLSSYDISVNTSSMQNESTVESFSRMYPLSKRFGNVESCVYNTRVFIVQWQRTNDSMNDGTRNKCVAGYDDIVHERLLFAIQHE